MIILDTDSLSLLMNGHERLTQSVQALEDAPAITVVTRIEVLQGRFASILKAADGGQLMQAQEWLLRNETYMNDLTILPIDQKAAEQFDRLRNHKKLKKVGRADLLIAGITLAYQATLVTRNLRHFQQVPGLTAVTNMRDFKLSSEGPMTSASLLMERLARSLQLTNSLVEGLDDSRLALRNGVRKSNTIGDQFWCLVGARESYATAIENATWQGFSCSLDDSDIRSSASIRNGLSRSRETVLEKLSSPHQLTDAQVELVMDLLEHEVQHHGQLIRFFYANEIPFPQAFAERYALQRA
jgi:tRNA(fMet)-specific endonuclease VapC